MKESAAMSASSAAGSCEAKARGRYMRASVARCQGLDHAAAQRFVGVRDGRRHFAEVETAVGGVFAIEAFVLDELRIEQRGACAVLAVVGEGVAVAVAHFGRARFADAQARSHDGAPERREPPARDAVDVINHMPAPTTTTCPRARGPRG